MATTAAVLAGHWTTGSEGLPPALLVLAVLPYLALALVGWLLYRHLRQRDGDEGERPPRVRVSRPPARRERPRRHP